MRDYFFPVCLVLMVECCVAQSSDLFSFNGNYVTFGVALPLIKYLDKGYSPNLYKGTSGVVISASLLQSTRYTQSKFTISYTTSTLNNRRKDIAYQSTSSYDNFLMKYSIGFQVHNSSKALYYVGPSILFAFTGNQYNNLKSNNSYAYDGKISLGVEGAGVYGLFSRAETLLFSSNHNVSVLTWSSRPNWTTMMPFEGIQPKFSPLRLLTNGKLLTFNKNIDFFQNIGLFYRNPTTLNFLGAQHQYYYARNTAAPHRLYTGIQSIGLAGGLIYR